MQHCGFWGSTQCFQGSRYSSADAEKQEGIPSSETATTSHGTARGNNDVRLALGHSLQLDWPPWQKNNRDFIASLPVIFTPSCFPREAWIPIPHLKSQVLLLSL